jgi:2-C-methyl-D-erythritol 2,4-cyclodiphosphate synthase
VAEIRSGIGFDVHGFDASRPLWLGGVAFGDEDGLAGHSDGDAVCHAIADAILGGAALGDVGEHFPDADAATEGLAGVELLGRAVALVGAAGFAVTSIDVTVIAERPSITPRKREMRESVGDVLGLAVDAVSVKATRPEGLGLTGEGIGCLAVAVLERR